MCKWTTISYVINVFPIVSGFHRICHFYRDLNLQSLLIHSWDSEGGGLAIGLCYNHEQNVGLCPFGLPLKPFNTLIASP